MAEAVLLVEQLLEDTKCPQSVVLGIYVYGRYAQSGELAFLQLFPDPGSLPSRVYGTNSPDSDWDIVVIVTNEHFAAQKWSENEEVQYRLQNPSRDVTIYSDAFYTNSLKSHEIKSLEMMLCPQEFALLRIKDYAVDFKLDLQAWLLSFMVPTVQR